jgi:nucleoside-diphosphate-sugar epimerase
LLTIACTINRAKQELGYKPLVDLREGMRRSVKWCLDHGIEI